MPAEWEPMAAVWLCWPHNRSDWPGKFAAIPFVYAEIVRHLARVGRVEIIVQHEAAEASARAVLAFAGVIGAGKRPANLRFHRWPTNRGWTRDSGPIFIRHRSGKIAIINWSFNGWAKYRNWQLDDQLPQRIASFLELPVFEPEFTSRRRATAVDVRTAFAGNRGRRVVLEGGSIDSNGQGLLLATEECLLSRRQQRNPGMSRADLEDVLGRFLGVRKVLWLQRGIAGDDTHGHVDDIARFVGPRTIVAACEADRSDANYEPLRENLKRLRRMTDTAGRRLRVIPLPMPSPIVIRGQRVPASYENFFIFNGLVLVPTFNQPGDRLALNTLAEAMPKHTIVPIYCGDLIWGLGAIHCMTQQQPG
ncbi:MAG: agmatine deiminase family protein [Candidatus Korobacteraceae bacterium]